MAARYAIYYAPDPNDALWQRAATWLGRDAAIGTTCEQPLVSGFDPADFAALTADPRHYGFHATLKAPFSLAEGQSLSALIAATEAFAAGRAAFTAPIAPMALGAFIALRVTQSSPEMQQLHEAAVREFDPFRAPPAEAELAKRRAAGLTAEQDAHLGRWGYPYVFEHFRFHMTLSGRVRDEAQRHRLLAAAEDFFAADCGPHRFAAISLFHQPDRQAPFTMLHQFPFGG